MFPPATRQFITAEEPRRSSPTPVLNQGKGVIISWRSTNMVVRDYDRHLYQARRLIEHFFAIHKKYQAIHIAAVVVWLNG